MHKTIKTQKHKIKHQNQKPINNFFFFFKKPVLEEVDPMSHEPSSYEAANSTAQSRALALPRRKALSTWSFHKCP